MKPTPSSTTGEVLLSMCEMSLRSAPFAVLGAGAIHAELIVLEAQL
jgi:hypothetical protein